MMPWIVDTCVVLDVLENDPVFGVASATLLQRLLPQGLAVSPVTMVELSAAFNGELLEQKAFLDKAGIAYGEVWTAEDTETAHSAWNAYVRLKRTGGTPRRPIADILIGAFANNRHGLVTRNAADFHPWFPKLKLRIPVSEGGMGI